ncbi:MAG: hypothetical protein Q7W54_13380 [Bacteroidota bacterium]|nr:hypothetical protein [Bacteroidota bacterium]
MNVTAKDNALISETAYSWRYPLPFAFRHGHKGDNENRPRKRPFQGKTLFSDARQPQAGNRIRL